MIIMKTLIISASCIIGRIQEYSLSRLDVLLNGVGVLITVVVDVVSWLFTSTISNYNGF